MQEQSSAQQVLQLTVDSVKRVFTTINPWKAAGPDQIPGCVLKGCSEQLNEVFCDIFNISLSQTYVLTCLKSAIIISLPKKSNPSSMNDYCPIALTPIVMKCFEWLVMSHIRSCLPIRDNRQSELAV